MMQARQTDTKAGAPATRPLSEMIIEMATIGFKAPFRGQLPVPAAGHILILLAAEAWNREVLGVAQDSPAGKASKLAEEMRSEMRLSQADLEQQLVSADWETIIEMMRLFKRRHFPKDQREIGACGYTPQGTVRVIWK